MCFFHFPSSLKISIFNVVPLKALLGSHCHLHTYMYCAWTLYSLIKLGVTVFLLERENDADWFVFSGASGMSLTRETVLCCPQSSFHLGEKQIEITPNKFYPFLNFKLEFYTPKILGALFPPFFKPFKPILVLDVLFILFNPLIFFCRVLECANVDTHTLHKFSEWKFENLHWRL